jgi:membrane protease YdiL (CAAX protease family)
VSDKKHTSPGEALICSVSLVVFSSFIHTGFPLKLISISSLVIASFLLSRQLHNLKDFWLNRNETEPVKALFLYCLAGIVPGILLAMFYRWHLGISLIPSSIHSFVIIALLIGSLEELVFRGFLQEQVRSINGPVAILFSSISHTGYKCCLFILPASALVIDIPNLAIWTFLFGILFGSVRHFTKSIIPSLIAHALFDIVVYAEFVNAPWWVW